MDTSLSARSPSTRRESRGWHDVVVVVTWCRADDVCASSTSFVDVDLDVDVVTVVCEESRSVPPQRSTVRMPDLGTSN